MNELTHRDAGFTTFEIQSGFHMQVISGSHLTHVRACAAGEMQLEGNGTHVILVAEGEAALEAAGRPKTGLLTSMFVVAPGPLRVVASAGRVLAITQIGYQGLWQVGGPLEPEGRLRYINGCSDTLLVCPPRLGEPCLNHLHIPPGTCQTAHTHPSVRIGIITAGQGECDTAGQRHLLRPGMGWFIPEGLLHSFHTEQSSLDVIAWHPDSDFGPTDECHPMLNRTLL